MRVWNYIVMMLTLIIFLEFVGFHTPAGSILDFMGIGISETTSELESFSLLSSNFFAIIATLSGVLAAGAVIVGFFTKTFDWKIVIVTAVISITTLFVGAGVSIVSYAMATGESWLIAIVATIFIPITAGFVWSIVDWFAGGND